MSEFAEPEPASSGVTWPGLLPLRTRHRRAGRCYGRRLRGWVASGHRGTHRERGGRRPTALVLAMLVLSSSAVLVAAAAPEATALEPPPGGLVDSRAWGWSEGAFSVSHDGAAQYRLPLWMPAGRGDVQPELALAYDSRGGNGVVGVGWSMQGLSTITPCARTWSQDGFRERVHFNGSDAYCLGGNRLLPLSTASTPEREYRTERDMFARIIAYGMQDNVPNYFRVWAKDGKVLTFGQSADAQLRAYPLKAGPDLRNPSLVRASSATVTAAWALNRIEDRNGNAATVEYSSFQGSESNIWAAGLRPSVIRYAPNRQVRLLYEGRVDAIDGFHGGAHTRTDFRLSRVEMWGGPEGGQQERLRQYRLAYLGAGHSITGRSLLHTVTECDSGDICLKPLQFEWSSGGYGFDQIDTAITDVGTSDSNGNQIIVGDIDGDGRDDLLYPDAQYQWKIRRSTGSGFGPAAPAGIPATSAGGVKTQLRAIDFDMDGRMDVMAKIPGVAPPVPFDPIDWWLYQSNGTSFVKYAQDVDQDRADGEPDPVYFADIDGNGTPDYLSARYDGQTGHGPVYYRLNSGNAGSNRFLPVQQTPYKRVGELRSYAVDTDGDGRAEVGWGGTVGETSGFHTFGLNADRNRETLVHNVTVNHFADINGDGLNDALSPYHGVLASQLNSGNGFSAVDKGPAEYYDPIGTGDNGPQPPLPGSEPKVDRGVRIVDFNNDGREDVLVFYGGTPTGPADNKHGAVLHLWKDDRFVIVPLNRAAGSYNENGFAWTQVLDVDGNGVPDIVHVQNGHLRILKRKDQVPDLLVGVGVGDVGARVQVSYRTLADRTVHTPGQCGHPQLCPTRGGSVVNSHGLAYSLNGPIAGWNTFSHKYEGGRVDLHGRGWLGFAKHTVTEAATGAVSVTEFDNVTRDAEGVYPFANLPKRSTYTGFATSQGREYQRVVDNEYAVRRLPVADTYTVELRTTTENERERPYGATAWQGLRTNVTQQEYDVYGNKKRTLTAAGFGRRLTQEMDYRNDTANWLIGRMERQVSKGCTSFDETECTTRLSTFSYDPLGNLQETVVEPNRPEYLLRTVLERTDVGNVKSVTTSDSSGVSRKESVEYNADKLYPTATANAMGHRTTMTVHSGLGVTLSVTDPNAVKATMRYDRFGRLRETNRADGSFEYVDHHVVFGSHLIVTTLSGGGGSQTVLDALGRENLSGVKSFGGGMAYTRTEYDALGRVAKRSRPYLSGETVRHTTFAYDRRGRLLTQTEPDGAVVRREYLGLQTHTYDAKGIHGYVLENTDGDIAVSYDDDPNSTSWLQTRFTYGPFGDLSEAVAADGTKQTMVYDILGRRTRHTDPSSGTTVSTINAFGELTSMIDATGQITRFEYDKLGRDTRITSPDGVATKIWDSAAKGVGRLASARSADGIITQFAYDPLGRSSATRWTIDGVVYEVGSGYDSLGRPNSVTYPRIPGVAERLKVDYTYNAAGYVNQVRDATSGTPYWQAEARNAAGRLERERYGNGVVGTRGYQPETGLLKSVVSTGPGSVGKLDQIAYDYDPNRNVTDRNDSLNGRWEKYHYDGLNRLTGWGTFSTGSGQPFVRAEYTYDKIGNLRTETVQGPPNQSATYGYGQNGAPPHALTSRNTQTYGYDSAGRQTTGPQRTVAYSRDGLPKVLTWGQGQRTDFAYDAAGTRVFKRDAFHSIAYVPGFERRAALTGADPPPDQRGVRNIHHIMIDGRAVAQVTKLQATPGGPVTGTEVAYLHADGQGSTVQVTGPTGQVQQELFYDAFGRRVSVNFEPLPSQHRGGPRFGYTGHEHDDELGLINMKGRIYDPLLRRFLTPDPIVQDPLSSQSHNRYSYVMNNPATRTDPTGFSSEPDWLNDVNPLTWDWNEFFSSWQTAWRDLGVGGFGTDLGSDSADDDAGSTAAIQPGAPSTCGPRGTGCTSGGEVIVIRGQAPGSSDGAREVPVGFANVGAWITAGWAIHGARVEAARLDRQDRFLGALWAMDNFKEMHRLNPGELDKAMDTLTAEAAQKQGREKYYLQAQVRMAKALAKYRNELHLVKQDGGGGRIGTRYQLAREKVRAEVMAGLNALTSTVSGKGSGNPVSGAVFWRTGNADAAAFFGGFWDRGTAAGGGALNMNRTPAQFNGAANGPLQPDPLAP